MRVLIVIDDLRRAGAQRVVVQEVRALHPHRIEFHVVALAHVPEPSFAAELGGLGVALEYLPRSGLVDPRRVHALRRMITRVGPDLVHTHLTYANVLGTLAAALAARPVVASLHNVDGNQVRWPTAKRQLEGFVLRQWAARVVVVCPGARVPTARRFAVPIDRTVVVPNAIDPASIQLPHGFDRDQKRRQLGVRPGEPLVCSVARLESSKGQRYLLHAFAVLRSRHAESRIRLAIIGGGTQEGHLRDLARNLHLADRVAFLGVREDVGEILAASDLFVLPSLNEGLSQAMLEAMALSTPVVATNVGGTADVLQPGRTGWRVLPAQPLALADAIEEALGRPAVAAAYARDARMLVTQSFNLPTHLSKLEALYASLDGGRTGRSRCG